MKKKRGKRSVERFLVRGKGKKSKKKVLAKGQLAVDAFVNALHASKPDSRLWKSFAVDLGGKILITLLWGLFFLFIFLPFLFHIMAEFYGNPQLAENTSLALFLPVLRPFLLFLLAGFLVGMLFNAFVWKITARERFTLGYYGKLLALRLIFLLMLAPFFYIMLLSVIKLKTLAVLFVLLVLLAFAHVYFVSLVLLTKENILFKNILKGFKSYAKFFMFLLPYVFIIMVLVALYFMNSAVLLVFSSIGPPLITNLNEQTLQALLSSSQIGTFFGFLAVLYFIIMAIGSLFYAYIRIFYYEVVRLALSS